MRRFLEDHLGLFLLGLAALCIVITRACLQSITIDEAGSFLQYAWHPGPSHWWPVSDNHVLNSILMRLTAALFGVSNLSARLPAIVGAVIYIGSALYLCLRLTNQRLLELLLFTCLVFNPLILDYLVAARGYSLAIGFFLAAVAVIATAMITTGNEAKLIRQCVAVSALLALSCSANFSFAIANGTMLTIFSLWAVRQKLGSAQRVRLAVASYAPGLLIGFILCGSVLTSWPSGELYFGSKQMSEMWSSLATGSFDVLNPNLVNPLLLRAIHPIQRFGPWLVLGAGLLLFGRMEIIRRSKPAAKSQPPGDLVRLMVLVSAVVLFLHWLAFKILQIPLPKDRTALFFLPLFTLALAGSLAFDLRAATRPILARCALGLLAITSFYFIGCLRLGYFKEWKFDSDTKTLYWILSDLRERCGIEKFGIDWRYDLSLNFYRENYAAGSLNEFSRSTSGELPPDRDAYAIFLPTSQEFIRQQKLQVIYHNDFSDAAVAIRGCPGQPSHAAALHQ